MPAFPNHSLTAVCYAKAMRLAWWLLVLAALAATLPGLAAEPPAVRIAETDPGLFGRLGAYDPLYLRLAYRSDRPLTLRAEGLAAGVPVPGMTDGVHRVPAGAGETMAWIAYPAGTAIDGIRIDILDDRSRLLAAFDTTAQMQWDGGARRERPAEWARRMSDAEQRQRASAADPYSPVEDVIGLVVMAAVPFYFVLQGWLSWAWSGRWRAAALVPLLALGPATLFSLYALLQGSNLWPITVILLAPFGLIYLLVLYGVRAVARRGFA